MVPYIGGYQSYLDAKAEAEATAIPAPKPAEKPAPKAAPVRTNSYENRFTFREQRDFDTIEDTIAGLEDELARLDKELEVNSSDYAKVTALMQAQQETQQKLEEAMDRWMFLQEKWERIQQLKGDKA